MRIIHKRNAYNSENILLMHYARACACACGFERVCVCECIWDCEGMCAILSMNKCAMCMHESVLANAPACKCMCVCVCM